MHIRQRYYSILPEFMPGQEPITRQATSIGELFSFVNWQGVGLVRYLYWLGMWVIGLMNFTLMIAGLASGQPGPIIGALIFVPVFAVAQIIVLRIVCEIAVVLLLMPYYSRGGDGSKSSVTVIEDSNHHDDDEGGMDVSVHTHLHPKFSSVP